MWLCNRPKLHVVLKNELSLVVPIQSVEQLNRPEVNNVFVHLTPSSLGDACDALWKDAEIVRHSVDACLAWHNVTVTDQVTRDSERGRQR